MHLYGYNPSLPLLIQSIKCKAIMLSDSMIHMVDDALQVIMMNSYVLLHIDTGSMDFQ